LPSMPGGQGRRPRPLRPIRRPPREERGADCAARPAPCFLPCFLYLCF
jgi:hypothetical protein